MAYTTKSFAATMQDLRETFDKWDVRTWSVQPPVGSRRKLQSPQERRVVLQWTLRGQVVTIALDDYDTDAENLRAIYNSVEALRLIEHRGVSALMRDLFAQLPPPVGGAALPAPAALATDPYAALGVTRTLSLDEIEAVYKAKARKAHPDLGGSADAMARLNDAIAAIRKERG